MYNFFTPEGHKCKALIINILKKVLAKVELRRPKG